MSFMYFPDFLIDCVLTSNKCSLPFGEIATMSTGHCLCKGVNTKKPFLKDL